MSSHAPFPVGIEADFVALDVETANSRASVCSIGLAFVRDSEIVWSGSTLVNPQAEFAPMNRRIHGIRSEDVADAPTMAELGPNLVESIGGRIVAYHSTNGFDLSQLTRSASESGFEFGRGWIRPCSTWHLARRQYPNELTHALAALAVSKSLGDYRKHDAGEDARTCARLLVQIARDSGSKSIEALVRSSTVPTGGGVLGTANSTQLDDLTVREKRFQLTGAIPGGTRKELEAMIRELGGVIAARNAGDVDFLVIGSGMWEDFLAGTPKKKIRNLIERRKAGMVRTTVLSPEEFWELVDREQSIAAGTET